VQDPAVAEFTGWWSTKLNAQNLNERVLKWVAKKRGTPFFLYVHYLDVHSPHFDPHPYVVDDTWEKLLYDPKRDVDDRINLYDGAIRYTDEQIRNLVQTMKKLDIYRNSLIILLSDHGEEFLEHGGVGHGLSLYEEQLQIPLIIFPTAVVPGHMGIDTPVSQIDLFPTLNDWMSLGAPYKGSGLSLKELILSSDDSRVNARKFIFAEMDYLTSIRSVLFEKRWKYILNMKNGTGEIYDLMKEPSERNNLLVSQPTLSTSLEQTLTTHFTELGKSAASPKRIRLDNSTKQSLKALGYLD
jgi:arylsulfatase A-like enzyme